MYGILCGFRPGLFGEFTPVVLDEIGNGKVPRLHDGKPDLPGPWVVGGSNGGIKANGGLKPSELPLLPWAKAVRESRSQNDEP